MSPPLDHHDTPSSRRTRDVFDQLLRLVTAPDRVTWASFCDIDGKKPGCAKFRQCPTHIKGVDERCWHTPTGEQRSRWCEEFNPSPSDPLRYVVAYSYGVVCKSCTVADDHGPEAGRRRQCAPPCPFYGCAVPGLVPTYVDEERPPNGCPYTPEVRASGADRGRHANTYARVQCFISRQPFVQVQAEALGLHMGYFAFVKTEGEVTDLYYLARHHFKNLHLTHLTYDPRAGWSPDTFEHEKSYLFQASREGPGQVINDEFFARLCGRDAVDDRDGRPLSVFEREHHVLYVEDGEMTAYCLRWLLEQGPTLWGPAWPTEDDGLAAATAAVRDPDTAWYDDSVSDEFEEPAGNAVERYLLERHLLPSPDGKIPRILRYMGFTPQVTGVGLLEALGVVAPGARPGSTLATERFWRLVRYLVRHHPPTAPDAQAHVDRFLTLADRQRRSGRSPRVELNPSDVDQLLLWVASGHGLHARHAPMTSSGIPGHIMLRRSFFDDLRRGRRQRETCARSWIVFPIYAYEPAPARRSDQVHQVGFFIGTFDDSDCYGVDGELHEGSLTRRVSEIRQWIHVVGSVEASATYVEDIVSSSNAAQALRDERDNWLKALRARGLLPPEEESLEPEIAVGIAARSFAASNIDLLVSLPLALQYSMAMDHPAWDPVAHGWSVNLKNADSATQLELCRDTIVRAYSELTAVFASLIRRAETLNTGHWLLDLVVDPGDPTRTSEPVHLLAEIAGELQHVLTLSPEGWQDLGVLVSTPGDHQPIYSVDAHPTLEKLRKTARDLHGIPRAASSYVIPYDRLYLHLLDELLRDRAGERRPFVAFVRGPLSDAAIDGGVLPYWEPIRADAHGRTAEAVVGDVLESDIHHLLRGRGVSQTFDIWVACRGADKTFAVEPFESQPLTRDAQRQDITRLFDTADTFADAGVYWLVVIPWLVHREGKQRWDGESRS